MKKLIAFFVSVSCLLAFSACGANTDEVQNDLAPADEWGITLTVKGATDSGLTLVITQSGGITGGSLETGADYYLERSSDGANWSKVPPLTEPAWDMMARIIHPDDSVEWELDWSWLYGQLEAGHYRICKTITLFGDTYPAESRFYSAEFTIGG